jgi:hypothetical protein
VTAVASSVGAPRPSTLVRALGDGAILAGLLFAGYLFIVVAPAAGTFGFDAYAYWRVDVSDPYRLTAGALGAFTYSPAAARVFAVASALSWFQFLWLWTALLVGTVIWLGGRSLRTILALFAFPPVALELYHGNVHLLMAAAIVLGFRYPAAWALLILTKVTPGIGLLWFAVRGEWRSFAIACGVTLAIVGVSLALDGPLWLTWIGDSLAKTAGGSPLNQVDIPIPLWLRLPVSLAIVAWGAKTDRRWTVAVAATLSLPILWPTGFSILAAIPLLQRASQPDRPMRALPAWLGRLVRPGTPGAANA